MGIESRDYLRGESGPRSYGGGSGDVVTKLIIANVVVFILQLVSGGAVENWFALGPDDVTQRFQIWRLVTYAFCHDPDSIWHILFNMYVLYLTGRRLQAMGGPREFLVFYLAAAVVSGLGFVLLEILPHARPMGFAIGASGAVASVFIVYAMRYPDEVWRLLGLVPVQVKWLCALFIAFDLHPLLLELGGRSTGTGVAHAAHLGGYLFGFLYEHNHWQLSGLMGGLSRSKLRFPRRRSHLRVFQPEDDAGTLESQVDELLKKVHEQGEASLTDKERAILSEASRRYRNRL